jgi:hypothetical protein
MPGGTYEDEVKPIPGDVFLDRVLGWLAIVCTLPVLGFAIYLLNHPPDPLKYGIQPWWTQYLRVFLIVLALIGLFGCTRSTAQGFRVAGYLFAVRLAGAIVLIPYSGGLRFSGTEILFDLVVIGYAYARLRSLERKA